MDYGVQFNKLMYERLMSGGDITLFSPNDVPGLYDAFFADQDKFRELYEAAERKTSIRKKKISATELFSAFMQERKDTGRIYLQNVDHANEHSSFKTDVAPIFSKERHQLFRSRCTQTSGYLGTTLELLLDKSKCRSCRRVWCMSDE